MATRVKTVFVGLAFLQSGTFLVPADYESLVSLEAIGAGGAGNNGSTTQAGGGGGGGAYAKTLAGAGGITATLTPGQTIYWQKGPGGEWNNSTPLDSYINIVNAFTPPTSVAQGVLAKAGANGPTTSSPSGGTGGTAAASIGNTKFSGGSGGSGTTSSTRNGGGGGGGAAGPSGAGASGGASHNAGSTQGGGGGGAANGGSIGQAGTANLGGNGGAISGGTFGVGYIITTSTVATAGTKGGGGGGGAWDGVAVRAGGSPSTVEIWQDSTTGAVSGPSSGFGGNNSGTFGFFGCGSGGNGTGSNFGGEGVLIFTYNAYDDGRMFFLF